jgi:DNA-binding NarL/FixJ family response regulator
MPGLIRSLRGYEWTEVEKVRTRSAISGRELDIATRVTRRSSDPEIGKQLKVTWGTVHNHRNRSTQNSGFTRSLR